jgi:hypothetical protein
MVAGEVTEEDGEVTVVTEEVGEVTVVTEEDGDTMANYVINSS